MVSENREILAELPLPIFGIMSDLSIETIARRLQQIKSAVSQENMGMIGDERPSKTKGFRLGDDITQTFNKIIPVLIIGEYPPPLDSTNNNMM